MQRCLDQITDLDRILNPELETDTSTREREIRESCLGEQVAVNEDVDEHVADQLRNKLLKVHCRDVF